MVNVALQLLNQFLWFDLMILILILPLIMIIFIIISLMVNVAQLLNAFERGMWAPGHTKGGGEGEMKLH